MNDNDKIQVVSLFPTPIYKAEINLSDEEINHVKDYKIDMDNMLGNFYSEEVQVLDDPIYTQLKQDILSHVKRYSNDVLGIENEMYICLSWFTRNPPGSQMHRHQHRNSFISGCLYFTDGSPIKFWADKSPIYNQFFDLQAKEYNLFNSSAWTLPIDKNYLLLWPSYVQHSVEMNDSNSDRISLAFNVFIKKEIGSEKFLTHLSFEK